MKKGHFKSLAERLEKNTFVVTYDRGCWLWVGATSPKMGYGLIGDTVQRGRNHLAHRVAWAVHFGPIPRETPCVLHSCDTPNCVRPDHLFLGTKSDNNRDRDSKGRGAKGSACGNSVLTESDVRRIRALHVPHKVGAKQIAFYLGLPFGAVHGVLHMNHWKHVQ